MKRTVKRIVWLLALVGTLPGNPEVVAGDPIDPGKGMAGDKSGYTLFDPTPPELWRELSPDRPDATESPLTLDAGAMAVEASYFDWRRDDGADSYTVMATNFKIGLTNSTDLQVVFDAYSWDEDGGPSGFGDVQVRLKWNLWGNDGGDSAFALFPFIKIPTGTELSNGEVEGGLILPYATDLADGIGLGVMGEIDAVFNEDTGDHDIEFLHTVVLGFDLAGSLGAFVEYVGITGESTRYRSFAAGGLTLGVNENLILDVGTQVGLNENSEDLGVFAGFTARF